MHISLSYTLWERERVMLYNLCIFLTHFEAPLIFSWGLFREGAKLRQTQTVEIPSKGTHRLWRNWTHRNRSPESTLKGNILKGNGLCVTFLIPPTHPSHQHHTFVNVLLETHTQISSSMSLSLSPTPRALASTQNSNWPKRNQRRWSYPGWWTLPWQ